MASRHSTHAGTSEHAHMHTHPSNDVDKTKHTQRTHAQSGSHTHKRTNVLMQTNMTSQAMKERIDTNRMEKLSHYCNIALAFSEDIPMVGVRAHVRARGGRVRASA